MPAVHEHPKSIELPVHVQGAVKNLQEQGWTYDPSVGRLRYGNENETQYAIDVIMKPDTGEVHLVGRTGWGVGNDKPDNYRLGMYEALLQRRFVSRVNPGVDADSGEIVVGCTSNFCNTQEEFDASIRNIVTEIDLLHTAFGIAAKAFSRALNS